MAGVALSVIATLIGVFVLPDAIIVGTDTAVGNEKGRLATFRKYCETGPRSVAVIQGRYGMGQQGGPTLGILQEFRSKCSSYKGSVLADQAVQIAESLKTSIAAYAEKVPTEAFAREFKRDRPVVIIMVAGYEDSKPVIAVQEIRAIETPLGEWRIERQPGKPKYDCRGWFFGMTEVVTAVQDGLERVDRARPDIDWLAQPSGVCVGPSYQVVKMAFEAAVELTIDRGTKYKMVPGAVGGPVDMVQITKDRLVKDPESRPDSVWSPPSSK